MQFQTQKTCKAVKEAISLTENNSVIMPQKMFVTALCKQILTLIENIRIYDKQIRVLFNTMPDAEFFKLLQRRH